MRRLIRRLVAILAVLLLATLAPIVSPVLSAGAWTAADSNTSSFTTASSFTQPLYAWGYAYNGRTGVVLQGTTTTSPVRGVGLERWKAVSAGYDSTCLLAQDGLASCVGYNGYGQLGDGTATDRFELVPVSGGTAWSQITKGYVNTCAVRASDSSAWCWGYNPDGEVGNGTTASPVTAPVQVTTTGTTTWSSVTAGQYFTCGIKTDHTLWCWGYGANGRTGLGSTANVAVPTQVGTNTWSQVSAGYDSACGVQTDNSLWCWGQGANGQLGNGATGDQTSPVSVGTATWSSVSGGLNRSCGLQTNRTIWCWGAGVHGGLGNGGTSDSSVPVQEALGFTDWAGLDSGSSFTCAYRSPTPYCWGENTHGQLADGTTTDRSTPTPASIPTDIIAGSAGDQHVCAIRSADNGFYCAGEDTYGKAGNWYNQQAGAPTPVSAPGASWTTGSTGFGGGCGIRSNSTLWCWGDNDFGETGLGDTADHIFPAQVGSNTDWTGISRGYETTCGLRGTALYCWGQGGFDQLGTGSTADQHAPAAGPSGTWSRVSVGETHTCGLTTAGALQCWGQNGDGQIGDGSTTTQPTPVTITAPGVTTWASVSAGYYTTCAIAATGSAAQGLFCWGRNSSGQTGAGNTTSPQSSPVQVGSAAWSSVSVGKSHVCGVRTGGTLWCWGLNDQGQLGQGGAAGTPATLSSPAQVGSGSSWSLVTANDGFTCAVRTDASPWCWGRDDDGQLGDRGSAGNVTAPQRVPLLKASFVTGHGSSQGVLAMG